MPGPTVTLTFAGDSAKLDKAMKGVGDGARKMGREVEQASDKMAAGSQASASKFQAGLGKLKAAAAVGGGAIAVGLGAAFAKSLEFGSAQAKLDAQLGSGSKASQQAGNVAGDLYADAFGQSMADVGEAVKTVMQSGVAGIGATDDQVKALTGNVMSLSDAFGQDLNGTVNAVGQMMRTGLARNGQEALDILTAGFQAGNDKAGDLLDTFNEYGTQFRKVGLDGKTAMGLISQGLKAGARDADIVADSIKEFSIRAVDGSKSTAEGFSRLGLSAKKMSDEIAAGGPRASAALGLTLDKLREIRDPAERAQIAVQLFGTQAEDLGDALYALDLDTAAQGMGNIDGAAQKLNETLNDTAANKIEAVRRGFEQWGASIVEIDGPVGDLAAGIAAFGPSAMGTLGPLASMVAALRMNGAVSALQGVGGAIDDVDAKASRAASPNGGASRLKGALKMAGVAAALGAVAIGMDKVNESSSSGNLSGWNGQLHDMTRIMTGDWGNALEDMSAQLDQWKRNVQAGFNTDGSSNIGKFFGWLRQQMNEPLPPITFDVDDGPAQRTVDRFIGDVNKSAPEVNINGNSNGAGFALRTILDSINRGEGTVTIDGRPIPAQEALRYVVGLIDNSAGMVDINGNRQPAGQALAATLGQINGSRANIGVGANTSAAESAARNFIARWNGRQIYINIGGGGVTRAAGGPIIGPGTATSDSIPAMLSNGEHVLTAREVRNAGGHAAIERLRSRLALGPVQSFAGGGAAGPVAAARGGVGGRIEIVVGPGGDAGVATLINFLARTGKLNARVA